MCLHNSIAVAVAALYNQIDIVVAADNVAAADAAAHEYIAEIRKGIDVVVDKTSVVACSERTSAPKETSLESNIYPPHTRTLHSWKIDHHQCQYHH